MQVWGINVDNQLRVISHNQMIISSSDKNRTLPSQRDTRTSTLISISNIYISIISMISIVFYTYLHSLQRNVWELLLRVQGDEY